MASARQISLRFFSPIIHLGADTTIHAAFGRDRQCREPTSGQLTAPAVQRSRVRVVPVEPRTGYPLGGPRRAGDAHDPCQRARTVVRRHGKNARHDLAQVVPVAETGQVETIFLPRPIGLELDLGRHLLQSQQLQQLRADLVGFHLLREGGLDVTGY